MDKLIHYFPYLNSRQKYQFSKLGKLYNYWNTKINVISRKDINQIYIRHIIHSLSIAKVQSFKDGSLILDVGTGGGFPGVPLAILHPQVDFYLVDSIGKKIKVVKEVVKYLGLYNIKAEKIRAEKVKEKFDFIVSRAVTNMPVFYTWVKNNVSDKSKHELANGILYLKGGDLTEELSKFSNAKFYNLKDYFQEDFFKTKKLVHIPI